MKIFRFLFRSILFLSVALAIVAGLLVFQMSNGSVSAGFLKQRIISAAEPRLPAGTSLELDDLLIAFGPQWSFVAEAPGLVISSEGKGRAEAGLARIELDALPMLKGQFVPRSVVIDGLSVNISQMAQADLPEKRADRIRTVLAGLANGLAELNRRLAGAGLRKIQLSDIRIAGPAFQHSNIAGKFIEIPIATWLPTGIDGRISAQFASDQGRWRVELLSGQDPQGQTFADFDVSDFPPSYFAPRIADPARRPYFDALANIEGRLLVDDQGRFAVARTHVALGPGYLSMRENDASIIDRVDMAMELLAGDDRLQIARSDIRFGGSHILFRGGVDLSTFGEPLNFDLELGKTRFASSDGDDPVILEAGFASGSFDLAKGAIRLDKASLSGPEGVVSAVGGFRARGTAPGLSGAVTIEETTVRMARALWLPIIARKTRSWFNRNVKSGLVGPGTVQIALPLKNLGPSGRGVPLPADGVVGEVPFRYGLFTPLPDLPLVRNAFGTLAFRDGAAIVTVSRADVTATGHGVVNVGETKFEIPELGKAGPVGRLDLILDGPAPAVAALSNAGRLNIAEDRGMAPADVSGEAKLALQAAISLDGPSNPNDVDAQFVLALSDFASRAPINGQNISKANVSVAGSMKSYSINGDAEIDGIPAKISVGSGAGVGQSTIRLEMDEEARKKLGIDLGNYLTGDIVTSITPQADEKIQDVSIDLTNALVKLPFLGWQKGRGVPATFKARIERTPIATEFRDVEFSGPGFRASGDIEIDADGKLAHLVMRDISLKPGDDFSVAAERSGRGYKIDFSGASFDARGMVGSLQSGPPGASRDKFTVNIKLGQVQGFNGVSLSGLNGTAVASGGRIVALALRAGAGSAQPVDLNISEDAGTRVMQFRSANGGALLRFLNIYQKAYGGDLTLLFSGPAGSSDGAGSLTVSNFRVQNEALFDEAARERARNTDPDREVRSTDVTVDTTNLSFAKLKIPFSRRGGVISITDGSLRGPVVGASGKGTIDVVAQNISLSGTIVPAYGINNLPGSIPILGQLLGGRKREGLIGITYQIYGPLSAPTLKINPASAIAPGIFRRIFEYN